MNKKIIINLISFVVTLLFALAVIGVVPINPATTIYLVINIITACILGLASILILVVIIFIKDNDVENLKYQNRNNPRKKERESELSKKLSIIEKFITLCAILYKIIVGSAVPWLPFIVQFVSCGFIVLFSIECVIYTKKIHTTYYELLIDDERGKTSTNPALLKEYDTLVEDLKMMVDIRSKEGKKELKKLSKYYYTEITNKIL